MKYIKQGQIYSPDIKKWKIQIKKAKKARLLRDQFYIHYQLRAIALYDNTYVDMWQAHSHV